MTKLHAMRDADPSFAECLQWLLELRLKVRGNAYATEIVDRCLAVCGKAGTTDPAVLRELEAEVAAIADSLAMKFGAPRDRLLN